MWASDPPTYKALLDRYQIQYDNAIRSGEISPFLYPQNTFNAAILLLFLLIPTSRPRLRQYARYPAFALIVYFSITTIKDCRSMFCALGFGIGLMTAWGMLWSATLMLINDAPTEFKRIEKRKQQVKEHSAQKDRLNGQVDGASSSAVDMDEKSLSHRQSPDQDGHVGAQNGASRKGDNPWIENHTIKRIGPLAWQTYPLNSFLDRLDWIVDIVTNFRGMGWNWCISGLPAPPTWVQKQLQETEDNQPSKYDTHVAPNGIVRYHDLNTLLKQKAMTFIIGYLVLDACKVVMMMDPYFWGLMGRRPPTYLPELIRTSPPLLRAYRLLLSLCGIHTALQTIFALGPLFFAGIVGPKLMGVRAEPWMFPDTYGSFSNVLDKGLGGWWGGWWHQTFRFAFSEPSRWAVEKIGWDRHTLKAKALQLFVAFALSGMLHGCGSYTQLPTTRPFKGPFLFFFSQPVGIILQRILCITLKRVGILDKIPKWIRQTSNFVYVHVWFYFTGPLLTDDFSKGGVWLFEPIPISLIRGLGFGLKGEGWWCWGGRVLRWHQGERWWQSGIAI
ncbi:MAG: hypothetical protein M1812_006757 [Candelaria pacifica]|nr:MAG: hypothetical protein M1812_006757 [Candelaria pacifica]